MCVMGGIIFVLVFIVVGKLGCVLLFWYKKKAFPCLLGTLVLFFEVVLLDVFL